MGDKTDYNGGTRIMIHLPHDGLIRIHDLVVTLQLLGREQQRIPVRLHCGQHDLTVALQLLGRVRQRIP
eukprot:6054983-Prymnesium_polylepis.1